MPTRQLWQVRRTTRHRVARWPSVSVFSTRRKNIIVSCWQATLLRAAPYWTAWPRGGPADSISASGKLRQPHCTFKECAPRAAGVVAVRAATGTAAERLTRPPAGE